MRVLKSSASRARTLGAGLVAPALVGLLGAAGCSQHGAVPAVDPEQKSLVQLELTYSRELGEAQAARLDAEAHFVRYRAADRAVDERVVAGLLGFSDGHEVALDACAVERGADTLAPGALEVALLDAGPLTIRDDDALLAVLEPHAYPELLQFVTGVVYAAELALPSGTAALPLVPQGRVEIEAQGGEDVGPFLAGTRVPPSFPELRTSLSTRELELTWLVDPVQAGRRAQAGGAAQPGVAIELRWAGEHPGVARCLAADDGRFLVPRALSPDLEAALKAGAVTHVSVARSERSTLEAPGAGPGQVIVTLRDVATLADAKQR